MIVIYRFKGDSKIRHFESPYVTRCRVDWDFFKCFGHKEVIILGYKNGLLPCKEVIR